MNRVKRFLVFAASVLLAAVARPATQATYIEGFLNGVDFAVVGEVSSETSVDTPYSFTLAVHRSLKGDLRPGATVPVKDITSRFRLMGHREFRGEFGLWFLARDKLGGLILAPPGGSSQVLEYAYYPLPSRPYGQHFESSPLVDSIFFELSGAVESARSDEILRHLASGVLSCVGDRADQAIKDTLDRWSHSSSPNLVTLGLTGLVKLEDSSALARSRDSLTAIKDSPLAGSFAVAVFAYRNPDPKGVKALGEMVTREFGLAGLRSSAGSALRSIHTTEALPYLARLLDSKDAELRRDAVAGFAFFVNNFPVMTPEIVASMGWSKPAAGAPYRTPETDKYSNWGLSERAEDEQSAVSFWKSWWAAHSGEFPQPQP
jgi:hypothetical protein